MQAMRRDKLLKNGAWKSEIVYSRERLSAKWNRDRHADNGRKWSLCIGRWCIWECKSQQNLVSGK